MAVLKLVHAVWGFFLLSFAAFLAEIILKHIPFQMQLNTIPGCVQALCLRVNWSEFAKAIVHCLNHPKTEDKHLILQINADKYVYNFRINEVCISIEEICCYITDNMLYF